MPGTFSKNARPKRPGAYFNFEAIARETILPSAAGIVCVPIVHDWGPFKTPTTIRSLAEFQSIFGPTETTAGFKAAKQAFKGEGLPGRGGAGQVLAYRMGGSAAAKAAKTLQNTTPVNALTLTAIYEGTYGNTLTVTVQVNAADGTKKDLVLKVSGVAVESYTFTPTAVATLAATINAQSDWVTATSLIDAVALADVTDQSFAAGNDGNTLIAGDWTAMESSVETQRFGLFAPFDLTDGSILTSLKTWAVNLNTKGKRFMSVVGGALDENVSTANTRSASLNNSDFLNIGVGGVEDDEFGTLSTSQLAPRIAGILAQKGEERSLTFGRLAGVKARNFPTEANILSAFDGGTVVLSQDNHPDAPVRIEKGLTTYTGGDTAKPYLIFRNPKFVRTTHGIETELTEWAEENVIGQLQVNDATRALVVGEAIRRIKAREDRGVLQRGSTVAVDSDPPPTSDDEFVALVYGITFGRSVEQVFNTVRIG